MRNCKFSKQADKDIENIHEYTYINFGQKQARKYSENLFNKIQSIVKNEISGRKVNYIKQGIRKQEVGSHIVLYKEHISSILIVRVLHKSMDTKRHI